MKLIPRCMFRQRPTVLTEVSLHQSVPVYCDICGSEVQRVAVLKDEPGSTEIRGCRECLLANVNALED